MKIKTFEQTSSGAKSKETELKTFVVPQMIPRNSGRQYKSSNRYSYCHRLYEMFEQNELAEKKKTNAELKEQLLKEYRHIRPLVNRFRTYQYTIGIFRNKYNTNKLFAAQPPTWLISFCYNEMGYITTGGRANTICYFEDCYHHCVRLKIADPRFVPYETIVEIRNRQNDGIEEWLQWIVPTDDEIKKLATKLKVKEVYNSVEFYPGYTREETPHDFEPTILAG